MNTTDFPKLPEGYRWKVQYKRRLKTSRVVVRIKGPWFTTHADASGRLDEGTDKELFDQARNAAEIAYRDFSVTLERDALAGHAKTYQTVLNDVSNGCDVTGWKWNR